MRREVDSSFGWNPPKGAVVGPMIIVGFLIDEKNLKELEELEVKDSKKLSERKREKLYPEIKAIAEDFVVVQISAKKIDEERKEKTLNQIETENMIDIINALEPDKVIVDSTEVNTEKIEKELRAGLKDKVEAKIKMVVENYADQKYPVVSAASIIAKVIRDRNIKNLEERLGKAVGKGYPSDKRTIKFLKEILKEKKEFPDYVRKSWITSSRLKEENEQSKILKFLPNSKKKD